MLSGCKHETMSNIVAERHNISCRIIMKAVSKGAYARNTIYTDVGSDVKLMEQNLIRSEQTANKTLPDWFLPHLSATDLKNSSRPDAILVLPRQGCERRPMPRVQDLPISDWDVHLIEVKYCDNARHESQLARAAKQHRRLMVTLKAQGCTKVSLHIILLGVVGTIKKHHTETPLSKLGIDHCKVRKLTLSLQTYSVQYATKV